MPDRIKRFTNGSYRLATRNVIIPSSEHRFIGSAVIEQRSWKEHRRVFAVAAFRLPTIINSSSSRLNRVFVRSIDTGRRVI